ncbi:M15 family metallopeptidase [Neobacillus sp. D3-1R]|uniref:M15 family metallopeptidase n=1 Tax=Neobacillus sp. D3-1R TaxID=3445778 RepID=UPI003FA0DCBD
MKKLLLLGMMGFVLVASGCTRLDAFTGKIPFLKEDNNGQKIQQEQNNGQAVVEEKEDLTEAGNENETTSSLNDQQQQDENNEDILTLDGIYFNEIKEMNGHNIIQNPENTLALVNKQYGLPSTFLPKDLTRPNVSFSFGNQKIEKSYLRQEAAVALEKMFLNAKSAGIELFAVSGYRSYAYQDQLFKAEVQKVGEKKALEAVAYPGQSEHQTGLSMDISSRNEGLLLTEKFGTSKEGMWLAENAHQFGFILRYPEGKEAITGYQYEPWHFRYVGVQAATIIYEKNWTLEEYFNTVKKI